MYEIYAKRKDGSWSMVGRSYTLTMAKERANRIAHKGRSARIEDPRTDAHWDYGAVYSDRIRRKPATKTTKRSATKRTRRK